ncbi:MAG: ABC transporter substrate-binding protein [Candidatus Sulfotelmatobacter sp.]
MRLFDWRWFAVSSMVVASLAANAETRPQYGGVLHIAMRAAPTSLDPADLDVANNAQPDSFARRSLTMLMFDTLVTTDENGRMQPSLATAWQALPGSQRWQIRIRRGVMFHDGTPLTAEIAASSLRAANPSWNVVADAGSVIIEWDSPNPDVLAELALPRNAIMKRTSDSKPSGTGPFHVVDWQPGKKLALAAEENCWRGRPFLDAIEIEMGKSFRDQMTALELGKADLVEVAPEQTHRVSQDGRRLASSSPVELLALLFTRDVASPEGKLLREALALSVERVSIRSVLLQGAGQPTAAILPNWMSGYGFVFPADADLTRARQAREQVHSIPTWTLGYDGTDPLANLLAERIALNAKDAGLSLQPTSAAAADLRLVRIPLASSDRWIALADVATLAGLPVVKSQGGVEDLYASEVALLATQRVIPLFHLPVSNASTSTLENWALRSNGSWTLADAWLSNTR